jgi:hypothetical protein
MSQGCAACTNASNGAPQRLPHAVLVGDPMRVSRPPPAPHDGIMPKLLLLLALLTLACTASADVPKRKLTFNAQRLDAKGLAIVEQLEAFAGARVPDGDYWYDPASGASGPVGGGMVALLPPGLPLGGPLRADASGGGKGTLTGTFINGRELHPTDVAALRTFLPSVAKGRFLVDGRGNVAYENGRFFFNLYVAWQAAQPAGSHTTRDGKTWVGKGHATSTWGQDGGRITNHCSYANDGGGVMCSKTKNW